MGLNLYLGYLSESDGNRTTGEEKERFLGDRKDFFGGEKGFFSYLMGP